MNTDSTTTDHAQNRQQLADEIARMLAPTFPKIDPTNKGKQVLGLSCSFVNHGDSESRFGSVLPGAKDWQQLKIEMPDVELIGLTFEDDEPTTSSSEVRIYRHRNFSDDPATGEGGFDDEYPDEYYNGIVTQCIQPLCIPLSNIKWEDYKGTTSDEFDTFVHRVKEHLETAKNSSVGCIALYTVAYEAQEQLEEAQKHLEEVSFIALQGDEDIRKVLEAIKRWPAL